MDRVAGAGQSGAKEAPGFRAALSNPGHTPGSDQIDAEFVAARTVHPPLRRREARIPSAERRVYITAFPNQRIAARVFRLSWKTRGLSGNLRGL